ncbi:hypothetical protein K466DRAFT_647663 [Polyporus arcularius HHB13444]|uniref:WD40 repeat-like protein n=1 Tax=Polyporus arcularius HHB13444 TaxID=1314778 RepID=A0A5C3P0Z0_9APHY|nr:hypothetical protein K466DRAFT_647663 [Polyporus arcularius HHB13444]
MVEEINALQETLPDFAKTDPWTKTPRPHPLTTRLSRFRPGVPITAFSSTPCAQVLYYARAEVHAAGDYKSADPILRILRFDQEDEDGPRVLPVLRQDPGLSNVAQALEMDNECTLILLADDDRIKSFRWGPNADGELPEYLPNFHTMNSERIFNGPLAVLPGGRLLRAGKGKAAPWNLDALEAHQDILGKLIGDGEVRLDNSWRHAHSDAIDRSSGSKATAIRMRDMEGFSCISLDIEHGGRRVTRYLGHGHDPEKFATSAGDPNVFWTACADGHARMFDVRRPFPVLTFDTGRQSDVCAGIVRIHPDGVPTLFTGGERTAQDRLWDIRARACLYELSTRNNAVEHMLWGDRRMTLIAATDRDGAHTMRGLRILRQARVPRWATRNAAKEEREAYEQTKAMNAAQGAGSPTGPEVGGESQVHENEEGEGQDADDVAMEEEDDDEENPDDIDEEQSRCLKWPTNAYDNEVLRLCVVPRGPFRHPYAC